MKLSRQISHGINIVLSELASASLLRDAADEHASGWERFLGWLDTYFRSGARPPGEEQQMEEKSHE